jgi:hypothetical protein
MWIVQLSLPKNLVANSKANLTPPVPLKHYINATLPSFKPIYHIIINTYKNIKHYSYKYIVIII